MPLQTVLYTNSTASPAYEKTIPKTANHIILWSIPGGVQSIEFDAALSDTESFDFYNRYLGYRVAIVDEACDQPVAEGFISNVDITSVGVHVVARGFWWRHFDIYFALDPWDSRSTSSFIGHNLGSYVPAMSNDTSEIDETNTVVGSWQPATEGQFMGDIITKFSAMSDGNDTQWNYWVQPQSFDGVVPRKPVAHFEAQITGGSYDFQVLRRDIQKDSLMMTRDIELLANDVQVVFTMVGLTTDSGSWAAITTAGTDADSQNTYWRREMHLSGGSLPEDEPAGSEGRTIANQIRDSYLAKFKDPMLHTEFTISAPWIKDDDGINQPLWEPIKRGGGYVRLPDLFPLEATFNASWDRLTVGQIMEAEFSSESATLRLVLDQDSVGADAILARIEAYR